jgi:hypothetical protein
MSKEIATLNPKLPAELRALADLMNTDDEWGSGQASGFPVLSTKGKNFHVRRGDEVELLHIEGDPDTPAANIHLTILKTHKGVAKTYFDKVYEPGSEDAPMCYSKDGIVPAEDAEERQAKKCAICPHNQWGSRITKSGAKGKKCADVKRLAVALPGALNDPMLLRVPPTSLKVWDNYTKKLSQKGLNPALVITKLSFDPSVEHQMFVLKFVGLLPEDQYGALGEVLADSILDNIVDSADGGHIGETETTDDGAPDPEPTAEEEAATLAAEKKAVAAAKRKATAAKKKAAAAEAKNKAEEAPDPEFAPDVDDDAEEQIEADLGDEGDDLDELDFDSIDFGDDD